VVPCSAGSARVPCSQTGPKQECEVGSAPG
jgi:hypothetical protein